MNRYALLLVLALAVPAAMAKPARETKKPDTIYMNETVISGNQELPKVLYILPWRDDPGKALRAQAPAFNFNEVMQPIYPDEYRRALEYHRVASGLDAKQ